MAIVEVSVVPLGTGTTSLSEFVAGCVKVIRDEKDLQYRITPMGTVIAGDLDIIFGVIRRMHEQPFIAGAGRVLTTIRVDDRRDREATMSGKVAAVESKLSLRETVK
ncbi:MAG: MTH1187 family thiamine-binding protein [Peptococcaceae bacterium]|nr:MTH1187 family thiamine-binding protein [Peptococcaceae bacterium]